MKKRVILVGPPGAGKGTHAKSLTVAMNIPHISTGDMLRDARARGTELGKQADAYMSAGALVPDALVNGIVAERLASETNGYLLDGYPRTIAQAEYLASCGEKIDAVVLIDVADDVLVERIVGRLSCPCCGAVYHRTNMPPKISGKCDAYIVFAGLRFNDIKYMSVCVLIRPLKVCFVNQLSVIVYIIY